LCIIKECVDDEHKGEEEEEEVSSEKEGKRVRGGCLCRMWWQIQNRITRSIAVLAQRLYDQRKGLLTKFEMFCCVAFLLEQALPKQSAHLHVPSLGGATRCISLGAKRGGDGETLAFIAKCYE
jgi:hypothetical protein